MNILRRYTLHPFRSRHNPLTRTALIFILCVIAMAALDAVSELVDSRTIAKADKAMIAELLMVVEGKADMVERVGNYEVRYSVGRTTYEVR